MEIIPAIDLRNGRCVRLYQGDYEQETVFSENPVEMALEWQSLGAPRLHIVDLDGAASGELCNLDIIKEISETVLIPIEVGGGIRNLKTMEGLLKVGVDRVILGTAAVGDPDFIKEACRKYRDSIIIGVDARGGNVVIEGWYKETDLTAVEFTRSMEQCGARRFIYTDIDRDGTLTEPNFTAVFEIADAIRSPVIAAGGISSVLHLKVLGRLGVSGAIVGRALYTGDINLKNALAAIN
ncbi:1-(5-phosphoribosyl)-5-[(5-phosphoribosylamino)methylideneamino]imidazole-4-carboxamide isomerase [Chloroflexota bacterium]